MWAAFAHKGRCFFGKLGISVGNHHLACVVVAAGSQLVNAFNNAVHGFLFGANFVAHDHLAGRVTGDDWTNFHLLGEDTSSAWNAATLDKVGEVGGEEGVLHERPRWQSLGCQKGRLIG